MVTASTPWHSNWQENNGSTCRSTGIAALKLQWMARRGKAVVKLEAKWITDVSKGWRVVDQTPSLSLSLSLSLSPSFLPFLMISECSSVSAHLCSGGE